MDFKKKKTKTDASAFNEQIIKEEKDINTELFKKHFNFQRPSDMLKSLYKVNLIKTMNYWMWLIVD